MRAWTKVALSAAIALTTSAARADQGHSLVNTAGRFLGLGYTYNGYHSAHDGRFGLHEMPPSAYRSTALTSIYLPQSHARPAAPYNYTVPATGYSPASIVGGQVGSPVVPAPTVPAPVGPPPKWLQPYLRDGSTDPQPSTIAPTPEVADPEEVNARELDDFDDYRRLDVGDSPDALELDADDSLLDSDSSPNDDDLLLLDDDLSTRNLRSSNRYKQALAQPKSNR